MGVWRGRQRHGNPADGNVATDGWPGVVPFPVELAVVVIKPTEAAGQRRGLSLVWQRRSNRHAAPRRRHEKGGVSLAEMAALPVLVWQEREEGSGESRA